MSDDTALIAQLRAAEEDYTIEWGSDDLYGLAADAIARLSAERERPEPVVTVIRTWCMHGLKIGECSDCAAQQESKP